VKDGNEGAEECEAAAEELNGCVVLEAEKGLVTGTPPKEKTPALVDGAAGL
jgi:hypothetical protein